MSLCLTLCAWRYSIALVKQPKKVRRSERSLFSIVADSRKAPRSHSATGSMRIPTYLVYVSSGHLELVKLYQSYILGVCVAPNECDDVSV
jgi:hypothetical protein